jgi:hypothetical protein
LDANERRLLLLAALNDVNLAELAAQRRRRWHRTPTIESPSRNVAMVSHPHQVAD